MPQKMFPGNYVREMSSWEDQAVVALPGRLYYRKIGYALVGAVGATSFPIIIPSPDLRSDMKPRADISPLVIPQGANVYRLGLRVPDVRRDRSLGTARSGLVGTNTNRLKFASALAAAAGGTIASGALGTNSAAVVVANGTIAPVGTVQGVISPIALSGALTMSLYTTTSDGTTGGAALSSTEPGGTPILVDVAWYVDDVAPDLDDINLPFRVEN